MRIGYCRCSTADQNMERQEEALKKYDIEKWFTEKVSAKDTNRPKLQEMLEFVQDGDTVYVHDFSRLARSTADLLNLVERLQKKNVHLVSNKENIDSSTATGKLMLTMIGAIAEFERANLLERQKEGIAIAKAKGVYKGRQPAKVKIDLFRAEYEAYMSRKTNKGQFAANIGVTRPTLEKLINAYENGSIDSENGCYYVDPRKNRE